MKEDKPSLTAALVAAVRALYTELPEPYDLAPDPAQIALVPAVLSLPARAVRATRSTPVGDLVVSLSHAGLGSALLGITHYVALRTRAIDDALREAIADGIGSLVLLGAGLDDRAGRLRELAAVRVFEVDHPDMQRTKRERLARAGRPSGDRLFVPVDFERDRLESALPAAGLDVTARSFWIWEGVTVYLTPDAIDATLAAVSALSPAGSRIAITYSEPRVAKPIFEWMARAVGEPLRGSLERSEMKSRLEKAGFRVRSDEGPSAWAARYWPDERARVREWERLVVAERV